MNRQNSEEALVRVAHTFEGELSEDWLGMAAAAEAKGEASP